VETSQVLSTGPHNELPDTKLPIWYGRWTLRRKTLIAVIMSVENNFGSSATAVVPELTVDRVVAMPPLN